MTEQTKKTPWGVILIMLLGTFVALLNETLLNVALPSIMKDFNIQLTSAQWLSTAFMLTCGILIPITAFLIKKYSTRKLFLFAMTMFTIGTGIAGFAGSFGILLVARVIQASGTAILMPMLMNYFFKSFPAEKRGAAMGLFGIAMLMAPAIGPTLSGYIVEHHSWKTLFHLVLPFALFVLVFAFFKLKEDRESTEDKLHINSLILSTIGFGGLLYGLSTAGIEGWNWTLADGNFNWKVYASLIIGVIVLVIYVYTQVKTKNPMLDFRIYKSPVYALSSIVIVTIMMIMFSSMLVIPMFSQTVLHLTPLESGLVMLPGALINGIMMLITGRIFDKFGSKVLAIPGFAILMVTTYLFSKMGLDTTQAHLTVLYSVQMFGVSMIMMPTMTNGLNSLSSDSLPHGTAMNSTLQQVAGSIGTALMITVMTNATSSYVLEHTGKTLAAIQAVPPKNMMQYVPTVMQGSLHGMNMAYTVAFGIAIFGFVFSFFTKRAVLPAGEQRQTGMH